MSYKVIFSEKAKKDLKILDKQMQKIILLYIEKNLENCENPYMHGKALKYNMKGYWRYRVGDYRLICEINGSELKIVVITIGHRKEIYTK